MSPAAEALMDTAELTRSQRGIIDPATAVDYADHLSRLERASAAEPWYQKPISHERVYFSRGRILTLRWRDFGQPLPPWFDSVMQGFADLSTLEPDWDSYNAKPIEGTVIHKAIALLDALFTPKTPAPSIVPLSSGGLQVEWHRADRDLEIVFEPNQEVEFFYKNPVSGAEADGSLPSGSHLLIELIRSLE